MSYHTTLSSNAEAVNVLYEMVRQNLGHTGSVRCVTTGEEDSEVIARDTIDILKCLDIEHPVAAHVIKVCQGHKDVYGCGVKSLLFLIGQLCAHFSVLMEQGLPLFYIQELMNEAIDDCVQHLKPVTVPVSVHVPSCQKSAPGSASLVADDTFPPSCQTHSSLTVHTGVLSPGAGRSGHLHQSSDAELTRKNENISKKVCYVGSDEKIEPQKKLTVSERSHDVKPSLSQSLTKTESLFNGMCKPSQLFGTTKDLLQSHPSKPEHLPTIKTAGLVSVQDLNGFINQCKKPLQSKLRQQVMLRSRHLLKDEVASGRNDSSETQSSDTRDVVCSRCDQTNKLVSAQSVRQMETGLSHGINMGPKETQIDRKLATKLPETFDQGVVAEPGLTAADGSVALVLPEKGNLLSHGCEKMMAWATEVMHRQLLHRSHKRFETNLVHTCCIQYQGPLQLHDGLVIEADLDIVQSLSERKSSTSALLINGDLTPEFKHKGYKAVLSARHMIQRQAHTDHVKQSWHTQVISMLKQLDVGVVLVRGVLDSDLQQQSEAAGIAVLDRVPSTALRVLQAACHVDLLTYILEAHEDHVCSGLSVIPLLENWCDKLSLDRRHVIITAPVFIQTLVIREASAAGRQMKEEEFWHCLRRLTQAAEDDAVLLGGGATEQWCAHWLMSHQCCADSGTYTSRMKWPGEFTTYRPLVRETLASVFSSYVKAVTHNRQKVGLDTLSDFEVQSNPDIPQPATDVHPLPHKMRISGQRHGSATHGVHLQTSTVEQVVRDIEGKNQSGGDGHLPVQNLISVYDNFGSKVNGWRSAVNCVSTVMRMDSKITIGVDRETQPPRTIML